ncbi:hypothetical protein [Pontiella agarivorans]|uniref:Outer membrane protein beta-barrel domain-containing protein n=1 Tax=Pontiella agarivorans TaxID=3038953 RepID=A0ABU5MV29_9BACT|nr:hypothetical protein [Pontiella agarivorans]MDZ8118073.1 hypothetical protein [Pontiella agarivorans]
MALKRLLILGITVAVSGSVLAADEINEANKTKDKANSIRISLGSAPGIDEVEDSTGTYSVDDDGGARVEILYVHRFWSKNNPAIGGMLGGGIFIGSHALSDGAADVDLTTFGLLLQGGLAAKVGEQVVIEAGPYLGLGIAENETTGYDDGTGGYGLFGLKAGVFVLLGENVELGLEVGYEGFSHEQEYDGGWIGTDDVTFSGSGAHVAGVLAIKF